MRKIVVRYLHFQLVHQATCHFVLKGTTLPLSRGLFFSQIIMKKNNRIVTVKASNGHTSFCLLETPGSHNTFLETQNADFHFPHSLVLLHMYSRNERPIPFYCDWCHVVHFLLYTTRISNIKQPGCAVVDDEVSIIVENTLSLGSDQVSKVNLTASQSAKNAKASSEKHLWGNCFFLTANQPI